MTSVLAHTNREVDGLPFLGKCLALFLVFSTFCLVTIGGLVTSKGVGMAVPDWPTTYGYNMFLFPISKWEGGIFHEHFHRLVASFVGLQTLVLAGYMQAKERRRAVRWLAWVAVVLVCLQGVLGGKRVTLNSMLVMGFPGAVLFGVLHAVLAQVFLGCVATIAWVNSPWWKRGLVESLNQHSRWAIAALSVLVLIQLMLGATMRHQHAGLAIPDFPLAYGKLYPETDSDSLAGFNQKRLNVVDDAPITAVQVHLQMAHRALAVLITLGIIGVAVQNLRRRGLVAGAAWTWAGLIAVQFSLGAATVLSNKAADVATAHVAVGAATLLVGVIWSVTIATAMRTNMTNVPRSVADAETELCGYATISRL